jgi:DNA-binding PadR family transcriptional regulator
MAKSMNLTAFSYVVLTLVGRGGATAPELADMMGRGRMYWSAPRSQWYAEPKRLAEAGYLKGKTEPGETTDRTRYVVTKAGRDAIESWVRTPAALPAVKNEMIVRVMAADLLHDPAAVLDGLQSSVRDEITCARATVEQNLERARSLGDRGERLRLQHELTRTILDAYETYLDAIDDLLT